MASEAALASCGLPKSNAGLGPAGRTGHQEQVASLHLL
jgi:hypothetical protein